MIPAGWKRVRLVDVIVDAQAGFASGERSPNGVPQLRMNNVTDRGAFDWSSVLRVPADPETVTAYSLRRGDVLFNNTNSTALVGKSALFIEYQECIVYSNHFTRIRTDSTRLRPEYLALWLQFQWRQRLFENICNRWIGQAAVQRDKLLALEIPLPPIDEQRRIAAEIQEKLERIDQARAAAAAQLEAAKALPAAYLREVFESPDAQKWPVRCLGDIGAIRSGITLGRKLNGSAAQQRPYLRVANVKDGYLDLSSVFATAVTGEEIEKMTLQKGDLLLTEGGDPDKLGRGTVWNDEITGCLHQNHIFRVRFPATAVVPEFAAFQVGSLYGKRYFLAHAKQTTGIATINQKVLSAFPLLLPPRDVQVHVARGIASKLAICTRLVKLIDENEESVESLPSSTLRQTIGEQV